MIFFFFFETQDTITQPVLYSEGLERGVCHSRAVDFQVGNCMKQEDPESLFFVGMGG